MIMVLLCVAAVVGAVGATIGALCAYGVGWDSARGAALGAAVLYLYVVMAHLAQRAEQGPPPPGER